jgi:molecular chaperone GrpE
VSDATIDKKNEEQGPDNIATDGALTNEELVKALEEAKNKADENWNLFLRTRADMDNIRRRTDIDVDNARRYGMERFARELLAVVDSLEQGLSVAESAHDTVYREGMSLTLKLFLDIFEKFGVQRITPSRGEALDPNKHEAISMQATNELEPNKVLLVAQAGFMLQDRVLRPARVVVSKPLPE